MARYRKLWLVNALGDKYYLTNDEKSKTFLNNPTGFGLRRDYDTRKIGESELIVSDSFSLVDISGELVFYDSSSDLIYQEYQDFISFIKYKPLTLNYLTPNKLDTEDSSYYSTILITNLTKGDMSENGIMSVSITMHRTTPWYDSNKTVYTIANTSDDTGKYYPLVRPYHYAGTNLSNFKLHNDGTEEVGFIINIIANTDNNSYITNPVFSLYQDGVRYGVCAFTGTFTYITVNSIDGNEFIYLENNGTVISNPKQKQDFSVRDGSSYFTWCKLKVGESIFTLSSGNIDTFDGYAEIIVKNSYVSV